MELSLNRIELLHPQLVPSDEDVRAWTEVNATSVVVATRALESVAAVDTPSVVDELKHVLSLFDPTQAHPSAEQSNREDAAHDDYFHVSRVDGDKTVIFLRMVLAGRAVLLEEVCDSSVDSPETWQSIDHALVDLARAVMPGLAGVAASLLTDADPEALPMKANAAINPKRRWIRGHQLFAILTQGLLYSLRELAQAIRMDSKADMDRHIALSHSLLEGSGRAFTFTGGFSIEQYMRDIRPTMMPPFAPLSLSGLMSADHRYLVRILRDMRPALKALRVQDAAGHDSLADALSEVYELHKHVCERFVGNLPSIRTADTTDKSGPTIIEQFRKLRLKPFEQD